MILCFELTELETKELVTICDRFNTMEHSTAMPYVFTEQGVAMLSSVLNSERTILLGPPPVKEKKIIGFR